MWLLLFLLALIGIPCLIVAENERKIFFILYIYMLYISDILHDLNSKLNRFQQLLYILWLLLYMLLALYNFFSSLLCYTLLMFHFVFGKFIEMVEKKNEKKRKLGK